MKTIEKYKLDPGGDVLMPNGAMPLYVRLEVSEEQTYGTKTTHQFSPFIYCLVDTERPVVVHSFVYIETGVPLPNGLRLDELKAMYLGTFKFPYGGDHHLFYEGQLND